MSVKSLIEYDKYSDLCERSSAVHQYAEMPDKVLEKLNDIMDGETCSPDDESHPDNLWKHIKILDDKDVLLDYVMDQEDYDSLVEQDQVGRYIEEHGEDVANGIGYSGHMLLDHEAPNRWWVMS